MKTSNPREAAYLAVWNALKDNTYISDQLEIWQKISSPSLVDFNLSREIAAGSIRMASALDYIAQKLSEKQKLNLKTKEKALLRTAIYQFFYMDRLPPYAIVNESINIAKKYCHSSFVSFLNAVLRKISVQKPELPQGNSIHDLGIRYSYPEYFIEQLQKDYDFEASIAVLNAGNHFGPITYRIRPTSKDQGMISGTSQPMGIVNEKNLLSAIIQSSDYYIQNTTPVELISTLYQEKQTLGRILDLCSSPGGKIIALHDLYPEATLFANDVSPEKIKTLKENLQKYGISAEISCTRGEKYKAEKLFDLIILDVPCSNSGVLYKRPEARWRINAQNMKELELLQIDLIKNAVSLLTDDGEIWLMTCSILKAENEQLIDKVCSEFGLKVRCMKTILPNQDGWDGGFACALQGF